MAARPQNLGQDLSSRLCLKSCPSICRFLQPRRRLARLRCKMRVTCTSHEHKSSCMRKGQKVLPSVWCWEPKVVARRSRRRPVLRPTPRRINAWQLPTLYTTMACPTVLAAEQTCAILRTNVEQAPFLPQFKPYQAP